MPIDLSLLATALSKTIAVGLSGWTARETAGWGAPEGKLVSDALGATPAFLALWQAKSPTKTSPLQTYCELVSVAFGEAWRRHWVYDERLAPKARRFSVKSWAQSSTVSDRVKQVQEAFRAGRFAEELDRLSDQKELQLLDVISDASNSPWYRALFAAFVEDSTPSKTADQAPPPPPLLLIAVGDDRREFERNFRAAFAEGLVSLRCDELRTWLAEVSKERAKLIQTLLAQRIATFRSEHVFGPRERDSPVPLLPLEKIYVEPDACRRQFADDDTTPEERQPVLGFMRTLLEQPEPQIILVSNHSGSASLRGAPFNSTTRALRVPRC